jgi:hypothetical protein
MKVQAVLMMIDDRLYLSYMSRDVLPKQLNLKEYMYL